MRFAIILFVIANVMLFVAGGGMHGGPVPQAPGETAELSPERIRIVSRSEPPAGLATASPPAVPVAPAVAVVPVVPVIPVAVLSCLAWAELSPGQVSQVVAASEANGVLLTRETVVAETTRWWVHIPPLAGGKAGAEKKVAELRRLGIKRFSVVEDDGEHRYAISFGRFGAEADARKVLDSLRKKNVRSAQIMAVGAADGRERVIARGPVSSLEAIRLVLPESAPAACDVSAPATPPAAPKT